MDGVGERDIRRSHSSLNIIFLYSLTSESMLISYIFKKFDFINKKYLELNKPCLLE